VPKLTSLDHLVLTVASIYQSVNFFESALGMKAERFQATDGTARTAVTFGNQKINLHQIGAEFDPKAASPRPGTADICFLSDTDVDDWMTHLAALDIEIEQGPVTRTGATGPILSIYIRDPDGNLIEIANPA